MKDQQEKAQNALELLSAYGMEIIIVAVVLIAFFYFGVLNAKSFQARASPGSCSVYRADGPGSAHSINLAGVCDGELPQFVSRFTYYGPFANFGGSNITVPNVRFLPTIGNGKKITMTGWIYSNLQENTMTGFAYGNFSVAGPPFNAIYVNTNQSGICSSGLFAVISTTHTCIISAKIPIYTWIFVGIEYNGSNLIGYSVVNNHVYFSNAVASNFAIRAPGEVLISTPWNGLLSNVQLYNSSLTQNQLYQQYKQGIGGAPLNLKSLVGWWPLNQNLNDYSGNGNQGYSYNSAGVSGEYVNNYTTP